MTVPTVLLHIPFYHGDENTIGIVECILLTVQCILLLVSIFLTENTLKKTFNDDGTSV